MVLKLTSVCIKDKLKLIKNLSLNYTSKNFIIEGDNLQILKLMQKEYTNKIKLIYIDPPYNTGKNRLYKDNFKSNHSEWISMIRSRLTLARTLLSEDGTIFISIGMTESFNLRFLLNEIFGEQNMISEIVWNSKYTISNDKKFISSQHEYILVYAKNITKATF